MKRPVMVITAGIIHPTVLNIKLCLRILNQFPYTYAVFNSIEGLPCLNLHEYSAVVLYLHRKVISRNALDALDRHVHGGGGLLAIHSASASFKSCPRYFEILGGRFTTHGPISSYRVIQNTPGDEVFGNVGSFTIKDELYIHEWDANNHVWFHTETESGIEPVVWTRTYGNGRVCYLAPGHTLSTMKNTNMHLCLQRGLNWVSEGRG